MATRPPSQTLVPGLSVWVGQTLVPGLSVWFLGGESRSTVAWLPYDDHMVDHLDSEQFEVAAVGAVERAVPDADLEALRASFNLIRASTRLVQRLESEVHREFGWSMAGFRVMFCVWVGGEQEPRDIARLSGLSRAAVSSVLNTLERDGLVERSRESADRRLVTVRLTEGGAASIARAYAAQNEVEQDFFGAVTDTARRRLAADLQRLLTA